MAHLSLYRKYRSQSFDELIGQDHVVKALRNAVRTGKVAHSYLFTGPRGTGKTSTARLLAKCLCAEGGPTADPPLDDPNGLLIAKGDYPDVIEMDAASESGVDDVREAIVNAVNYVPMMGAYKVYIIDEVHDLSAKAFDALLKTIEEPPPHVVFVLATTEYQKVPTTIRSRCQKFEFHRASLADLVSRLEYVCEKEGISAEPAAIFAIARMADGGFRDALSLLEQALITSDGKLTRDQAADQLGLVQEETVDDLLQAIETGDATKVMKNLDEATAAGRDPRAILESMMYRLADLTRAGCGVESGSKIDASRDAALQEASARFGLAKLMKLRVLTAEAYKTIRDITLPRIWLESVLMGWAVSGLKDSHSAEAASRTELRPSVSSAPPVSAGSASKESLPPSKPAKPEPAPVKRASESAVVREPTAPDPDSLEQGSPGLDSPEQGSPEPASKPVSSDPMQGKWQEALADIMKAKAMELRMHSAELVSVNGDEFKVKLRKPLFLDWFNADPRRHHYIEAELSRVIGRPVKIKLTADSPNGSSDSEEAVELTLEGQALYQRASAIFNEEK